MVKTIDKIILGVLVLLMIGVSGALITAVASNGQANIDNQAQTVTERSSDISPAEAKLIALEAYPGTLTKFGAEQENGMTVYEAEIIANGKEADVLIDPRTGVIIKIEIDEDDELSSSELEKIGNLITESQAIKIAIDHMGGGEVIDFESEREDGRVLHEVRLIVDGTEAEVEIDAETGEVIEIEWGPDDD